MFIIYGQWGHVSVTSSCSNVRACFVALSGIRWATKNLCGPVNNCVLVPVVLPSAPANGDIRLANSDSNRLYGVLYIYLDGQWGTISYEGFTISAANVACRQLGQVGAENYTSTGQNSNALLPDNVWVNGLPFFCTQDPSLLFNSRLATRSHWADLFIFTAPLPEIVIRLRSIIEVGTFTDVLG